VCEALRRESSARPEMSDKELVGHQVEKIVLRRDRIEVEAKDESDREEPASASKIVIPFSPTVSTEKGITREPADNGRIDAVARQKLLNAIRRASKWVEAVRSGEAESFDEIAAQEGVGVRHVRRLARLAFVHPKVLNEVAGSVPPAELTVSSLTEALPRCWGDQYANFGSSGS